MSVSASASFYIRYHYLEAVIYSAFRAIVQVRLAVPLHLSEDQSKFAMRKKSGLCFGNSGHRNFQNVMKFAILVMYRSLEKR